MKTIDKVIYHKETFAMIKVYNNFAKAYEECPNIVQPIYDELLSLSGEINARLDLIKTWQKNKK